MASLFKRHGRFWVSYYLGDRQIRRSLQTSNRRVAKAKLRKIEYELATGQIRLASLVLRVAQANFVAAKTGRRPILLLDDVLLELDTGRRGRFLEALPDYEQAFFTFLPDEQYLAYRTDQTRIYRVAGGALERA